jgi:hypothetical protein
VQATENKTASVGFAEPVSYVCKINDNGDKSAATNPASKDHILHTKEGPMADITQHHAIVV